MIEQPGLDVGVKTREYTGRRKWIKENTWSSEEEMEL